MKRCVFGAVLLALIGLGCLWTGAALHRFTEPVCRDLELACQEALADNWGEAKELSARAQRAWEGSYHALASAADHTPLEDIDDLFAQLEIYRELEKDDEFSVLCAQLRRRLEAVGSAHALRWWNLL